MNAEQTAAAKSEAKWNLVLAGPGAGKTTVAIARAKELVQRGWMAEQMAFITFTNVAARVLKKRLSETVGKPGFVGTLHALMLSLLRRHDSRWTMISEEDADEFILRTAERMAFKGSIDDLKSKEKGGAAQRVMRVYHQYMVEQRLLDFDMVLTEGLKLLDDIDWPFPAVFVDEFQDSAPVDADIYLKASPEELFVVADPDQSIFAFRGACPQNVSLYWDSKRFEPHVLSKNYRCGSEICAAANGVIALNRDRLEKRTESATEIFGTVLVSTFDNDQVEQEHVVRVTRDRLADGIKPGEIAVLCRTNRLAAEMREALSKAKVPVASVESERKPKDWRVLLLLVRAIMSPFNRGNGILLARGLAKLAGMDPDAAESSLIAKIGAVPVPEFFGLPSPDVLLSNNADFSRFGIGGASHKLLTERIRIYRPLTLDELMSALQESPDAKSILGVNVMTVHASKGEEFDVVLVPGAEMFTSSDLAALEEERRLSFVAITRARREVVLSAVKERFSRLPNGATFTRQARYPEVLHVVERSIKQPVHA